MNTSPIVTDRLAKSYGPVSGARRKAGERAALVGLTLEVGAGEVFGLLGHNGAGKTTVVNLLTTLLTPTSGTAEVGGHSVTTDPGGVRRMIGYLPENVQFYDNLSLVENLRFFAQLSGVARPDARIRDVLRILDFEGHDRQRLGTFSKGMRQRVGIAQAILHSPTVLFLDEPTSGLDPEGVRTLRETIVRLNSEFGMTIFMNTHLLAEVTKTCTSIGILRGGQLVHQDTMSNTLAAFPEESSLEEIYFELETASAL